MGDRDREGSVSSYVNEASSGTRQSPSVSTNSSDTSDQNNIDILFGTPRETLSWEPTKPPPALGELLDSRYMLPLLFPSDPRMLAALPPKLLLSEDEKKEQRDTQPISGRHTTLWRSRNRKLREVGVDALQWVDGIRSAARWARPISFEDEEDQQPHGNAHDDPNFDEDFDLRINTHITPLTRKPSGRKGRHSVGADDPTPVDRK